MQPLPVRIAVMALLALPTVVWAKAAGSLLEQYLQDPKEIAKTEELALVEVVAVHPDGDAEADSATAGVVDFKVVESTGARLPATVSVRFTGRGPAVQDQWTWYDVSLKKGQRLVAFFNEWDQYCPVKAFGKHCKYILHGQLE